MQCKARGCKLDAAEDRGMCLRHLRRSAEHQAKYRTTHKTTKEQRQQDRKNKRSHFFAVRAYNVNWRFGSSLTANQLASLWHKQKGLCPFTGWKLTQDTAHLDHRIPYQRGGSTELSNLRWVHKHVNHAKWTLLDEEFFEVCKLVASRCQ